jgi:DNA-binding CsgD family transcriptional regulator
VSAVIAAALGEWASAARLLGAAAVVNYDVPFAFPERTAYTEAEGAARQQLGPENYAEAWARGRMMRADELTEEIERVLILANAPGVAQHADQDPSTLTARERDVLRLLVDGRSNREIAEILFISPRTATTHVTHILTKFGVETRAKAVTYAFQHNLV